MALVRRRFIASLLVIVACASFASSVCSGWQTTGTERMACCAGVDACSQVAADTCCGTAEQRQHGTTSQTAPAFHSPLLASAFAAFVTPEPDRRTFYLSVSSPRVLGPPPDTHLLLSVFLI